VQSLTYDNLPPGSTILREWKDGSLTMTFAAQEVGDAEIRRAARQAAVSMSWMVLILIAIFGGMLVLVIPRGLVLDRMTSLPILALALLAAGALFAMIWLDGRRTLLDDMQKSLAEQTVLIMNASSVGIQIQGPDREFVVVIERDQIKSIMPRIPLFRLHAASLSIQRDGLAPLEILSGRPPAELEWVAQTIRQIIGQSAESPPAPGF
jgi:hypothetical protein